MTSHPSRILRTTAGLLALLTTAAAYGGDPAAGKLLYDDLCSGCHAPDAHGVGPAHRAVFGKRAGTQPGYTYSAALTASAMVWNEELLRRWLTDPNALVAGNTMRVQILETAQERDDVIAYLKTLGAKTSK